MRLKALFATTALRLALRQALLQMLVLLVLFAALFALLAHFTSRQLETALQREAQALVNLPMPARVATLEVLGRMQDTLRQRYYRLEDGEGHALAGTLPFWPEAVRPDGGLVRMTLTLPEDAEGDGELDLAALAVSLPDGGRLLLAQGPGELEDLQDLALSLAALLVVLGWVSALVMGVVLGRQWLARITAINAVAGRIAAGALDQRVPVQGRGDEFDLLAEHLNAMLARIEAAVGGMREVSDHIAHDLRRPLTRLMARLELALRTPQPEAQLREVLAESLEDLQAILATFEALLTIARLEAGSELVSKERVELGALAHELHELYAPEFEEVQRELALHVEPRALWVQGSRQLLAQALANLLDNALKYTLPGTAVAIEVGEAGPWARLAVVDHGPGLTPAEKARMPKRFMRGDTARSTPGSGLGLALVRAVSEAHGGQLALEDTPGGGLTVVLRLPLSPP